MQNILKYLLAQTQSLENTSDLFSFNNHNNVLTIYSSLNSE